ncbi:hypothetical protein IAG41_15555 [Sphingomonas sp. JC676]|uniref:hypothetical protein n=1 Tax=Sphingomonas sp. JC676 TaxID=2768065 RepID=UPI001657DD0C|nr:hypothetical protein [Sphingomonas sp. JC676]MBC9033811.1 hypothetical protein [Sphingomonas sp. JC676]
MTIRSRPSLWLALVVPPLAWYGFQQGLATTLRGACGAAGVPLGPLWGAGSIALCIGAGWFARPRPGQQSSDRLLSQLGVLAAGLFSLAIFYQSVATMIIPPCAR